MSKVSLSRDDIFKGLNESIYFMIQSAGEYDKGNIVNGKRIGVELRKLLHDTSNSHSILKLLNLKKGMFYSSVQTPLDDCYLNWSGLTQSVITIQRNVVIGANGCKESPLLGNLFEVGVPQKFKNWWMEPVLRDWNKNVFTRKDIVLKLVNQDNGAHLDPQVDEKYYNLTRKNSMGIEVGVMNEASHQLEWEGNNDIHLAIIRQIAHEVLYSLSEFDELKNNEMLKLYSSLCK